MRYAGKLPLLAYVVVVAAASLSGAAEPPTDLMERPVERPTQRPTEPPKQPADVGPPFIPAGPTDWSLEPLYGTGPRGAAIDAAINSPTYMAVQADGSIILNAEGDKRFHLVRPDGEIERIAEFIARSPHDDLFDLQINPVTGHVYYVEGDDWGFARSFDPLTGIPGPVPYFGAVSAVSFDAAGDIYVAESGQGYSRVPESVFRWAPDFTRFDQVFGCGPNISCPFFSVDGADANSVRIGRIADLLVSSSGDIIVASRQQIYRVDVATNRVFLVAGALTGGLTGDGILATTAHIEMIGDITFDPNGHIVYSDSEQHQVRRVDLVTGLVTTIAGTGLAGNSGDGGSAVAATLNQPVGLLYDGTGNLYIADSENHLVRRVVGTLIETVAGTGDRFYDGELRPANEIYLPEWNVSRGATGDLIVASYSAGQIYRLDPDSGMIEAIAGSGVQPTTPIVDGENALEVAISPFLVTEDPAGDLYFSVRDSHLSPGVYKIDNVTQQISRFVTDFDGVVGLVPDGRLFVGLRNQGYYALDPESMQAEPIFGTGTTLAAEGVPAVDVGAYHSWAPVFAPTGDLYWSDLLFSRLVYEARASDGLMRLLTRSVEPAIDPIVDRGPFPPSMIPRAGAGFFATADPKGNILLLGLGGSSVYRIDRRGGDAVQILGAIVGAYPDGVHRSSSIIPISETEFYVIGRDAIYLAKNESLPPIARADISMSQSCAGPEGATVVLDASATTDPNDTPDETSQLSLYRWYVDYGQPTERLLGKGRVTSVDLEIGLHTITLWARDRWGAVGTDTVDVDVYGLGDPDGDGIDSCLDNCPALANLDQSDADMNGLGDGCDLCMAEGKQDADGDTVCDDVDNCSTDQNIDQLDSDNDGEGDTCDLCPSVVGRSSGVDGACVVVPDTSQECVPLAFDSTDDQAFGDLTLRKTIQELPSRLILDAGSQLGGPDDEIRLLLNGELIGTLELPQRYTSCIGNFGYRSTIERAAYQSYWNEVGPNHFVVQKVGTASHVATVTLQVWSSSSFSEQLFLSPTPFDCIDGQTNLEFEAEAEFSDRLETQRTVVVQEFSSLQDSTVVAADQLGAGEYEVCLRTPNLDGVGFFAGASETGKLYSIDPLTGASELLGVLPLAPLGLAHDPLDGETYVSQDLALRKIDLEDGSQRGERMTLPFAFNALTNGPVGFFGTETIWDFDTYLTFVFSINLDGSSTGVPGFQVEGATMYDLAYDETAEVLAAMGAHNFAPSSGVLYEKSQLNHSFPANLTTTPGSGGASISHGPAGGFYTVGLEDTILKKFTADGIVEIGETGIPEIHSLDYIGSAANLDCVTFDLEAGQSLNINSSCGAPVAAIAPPLTGECNGSVLLDASPSTDTNDPDRVLTENLSYRWYKDFGQPEQVLLGEGPRFLVSLDLGQHQITLELENRFGEISYDETVIEFVDVDPPALTVELNSAELWPPNGQMREISATVNATDSCSDVEIELISITSNQPDAGAISGADLGTDDRQFNLRARRSGSGARIYVVTYRATDSAGNATEGTKTVTVPHDQRRRNQRTENNGAVKLGRRGE